MLRQAGITELKQWLHDRKYISPTIINELITLLGNQVLRSLLKDVKDHSWYSIIADEVTDITNKEQFNISVRYVKWGARNVLILPKIGGMKASRSKSSGVQNVFYLSVKNHQAGHTG